MSAHLHLVSRALPPVPDSRVIPHGINDALRIFVEAFPEGTWVPVPRDALVRLLDGVPDASVVDQEDRLLTAEEAATRLGMSKEWLYRKAKALPFARRIGSRALRFSAQGLERWQARRGEGKGVR